MNFEKQRMEDIERFAGVFDDDEDIDTDEEVDEE